MRYWPVIVLATLLHLVWGLTLLVSQAPIGATPIAQTIGVFGQYGAAAVYLVASACALLALLLYRRWLNHYWLLLPQQAVLLGAAAGILYAVAVGHYADGTVRSSLFILNDQLPALLAVTVHTIVVFVIVFEVGREASTRRPT